MLQAKESERRFFFKLAVNNIFYVDLLPETIVPVSQEQACLCTSEKKPYFKLLPRRF